MSGGPGGGPRRRQPQYVPQYHHQQQHMAPMYPNYMPYGPQGYYGMPPQFQNTGMPSPGYVAYQGYARSPPTIPQYIPMVGVSVPPNYTRPTQQSPSLSTSYQPPPVPAPIPPQTPSSSHSSQIIPPPTPPTPQTIEQALPPSIPASVPAPAPPVPSATRPQEASTIEQRAPFRPPLPWLSRPDVSFPKKTPRSRRRRKPLSEDGVAVSLPAEQHGSIAENGASTTKPGDATENPSQAPAGESRSKETSHEPTLADAKPSQSAPPVDPSKQSDAGHSATVVMSAATTASPTVPVTPALPRPSVKNPDGIQTAEGRTQKPDGVETGSANGALSSTSEVGASEVAAGSEASAVAAPPAKAAPSSWAGLFAKTTPKVPVSSTGSNGPITTNGSESAKSTATGPVSTFTKTNASSVAEAIRGYQVGSGDHISFLEPRGLINTGNMCYMNSVLQVLMYCIPFHDFLDQVSKKAVHSFKSETPLIDAMIMFMREYKVLESAPSADDLRRKLKTDDLEKYGEPFTPEFVYEAIRQLARFASMRRGHQQDAEEFLGFLLQSLDDECTHVMGSLPSVDSETASIDMVASQSSASDPSGDWLEVGRKQRAAVTRSSGSNSSTPVTKIFGGLLRSEFRVPGLKDSITTEPYQPLQLDIGSPDVRNVVDALRGLTRPERLQGDFNSPRGKDVIATKQVFIESLPPVLILHLKRFQFEAEGNGTIKIWKKVGYPLELEIPREALSRQKRQTMGDGAMPKYRLISVVYHHGRNASGGHYTVDVRRQDGREWIRMDDTVLRRVRSEDVAEGGSEEEIKDSRKETVGTGSAANRFGAMNDEDMGDEDGWKQVTSSTGGSKRWSSVVNGTSSGTKEKQQQVKESIKDNKVAYLLFYQRIG